MWGLCPHGCPYLDTWKDARRDLLRGYPQNTSVIHSLGVVIHSFARGTAFHERNERNTHPHIWEWVRLGKLIMGMEWGPH